MEGRRPSVARSSRPPVFPRCGQSRGAGPAPVASSRKRSPKSSPPPRRVEEPPAPSRRTVTRRHIEDDETAFPTAPPPIDVSERVALVPAPRRPLRVSALATSRRQPLPKPREHHERACGPQKHSAATGSPDKRAVARQGPEGWFRRDMGDSTYVAAPAREAVEVDKSMAALLIGAIAEDSNGLPPTREAEEAPPNDAAAAPVPASRAPGRPQVATQRRGKKPVPSVEVYVELQKSNKEKRGDRSVGLGPGFRGSQSPINEDPKTSARNNGAGSDVSLTMDTSMQHQRRASLLQNISTSISTVLGRFFRKGAGAEQPEPAPRTGQAMPWEKNDDIGAALGANDEMEAARQRSESSVRSRHYQDRYRGPATSRISLTQIVSVRRRTQERKPLTHRHTDKQHQPPRRGKKEPEESYAKLPEVAGLPIKPPYDADKQPPKTGKAELEESSAKLSEVVELIAKQPEHARKQEQSRRGKAERKESSAKLPEVLELPAEPEEIPAELPEVAELPAEQPYHADEQQEPPRRGKEEPEKRYAELPEVVELPAEPPHHADKQEPPKTGKIGSEEIPAELPEVVEMPPEPPYHADELEQPPRRGKGEREDRSAEVPEVATEVTDMSSRTKARRASEGGAKGRGKNKRKKSALSSDVIEKTIAEDTDIEKSELKTKGKPRRRGSKKADEVTEITEISSGTKGRRSSEAGTKERRKKRKQSASSSDVAEKTTVTDIEKSELKTKRKPGRRGSKKDDEVTEISSGTKGRRSSEGGAKDRRKKRKKSTSASDVTEKTTVTDIEKSELKTKGKQGRRGSKKADEVTEISSGTKGRRSSEAGANDRRKKRKKSTSASDVTEKTGADDTEQTSLQKTARSSRKSSAVDKREKESSRKESEKKGYIEDEERSDASGKDRERRISRTGKTTTKRKDDAEESGRPDSNASDPLKFPGGRKKSAPEGDLPEDNASQESPEKVDSIKKRPTQAGPRTKYDESAKPTEESGMSILRTKSNGQIIPFEQRLSTKSASQRFAAALGKEDSSAPTSSERGGFDFRTGGTEEAGAKNTALLSPPTMPNKETRAEGRHSSRAVQQPEDREVPTDGKKDSAESSASEGKPKKRRRSKGERSAESDATGAKQEDSAIVQGVGHTTGSKTVLGSMRSPTKEQTQSGARKSRDESSRDAEKQTAETKKTEQPLESIGDVAQALEVREEAALVALPVDGGLLPLKSDESSTAADNMEAEAVARERQLQSPAGAEATAVEPGTAASSLQSGALAQERRRSQQGQAGADVELGLKGPDGTPQGGPRQAPAPVGDDGEPSRRRKISLEKEASRKIPQDANGGRKTWPLFPTQEPGPPEGGKQENVQLPEAVAEDADNRRKGGDGKPRKADSEGKIRKGKQGEAKGKPKGHVHKQKHKHGKKRHGHEHHKHEKSSGKESDEVSTRCVETQTCLAAPAVEKGGASCRDFNFGVSLIPITRSTLASNEWRLSGEKLPGDARRSSKDVPEVTKMLSDSPEPKSVPADESGAGERSKKRKSKRHSKGSKTSRKHRSKQMPSTVESKRSGTALSDIKREAVPEGDKKQISKKGGSGTAPSDVKREAIPERDKKQISKKGGSGTAPSDIKREAVPEGDKKQISKKGGSGTAPSDVKREAIPEGDKKQISKQGGSDLCECLPFFFDNKPRMLEPAPKPVADSPRTELGSDQGKKDVDRVPTDGVGDQSVDRKKRKKRESSKGRKTKRSKHGRKKVGKKGAQRELPEAGESTPFRFQWRPTETNRPLSWSTMRIGTETPWLLPPAEVTPSPENATSAKDVLQAWPPSSTVTPLVGVKGEPPPLREVSEKPKKQWADGIDDGDKDVGRTESPSHSTAKTKRGRSKGSSGRSKDGRHSKKGGRKPSKHGGKDTEVSQQRGGLKSQPKRRSGSRGKRSSSKRKKGKKLSPDNRDPKRLLSPTGPENQASAPDRPPAKKADEKAAPIEVTGEQGSRAFDFVISRPPVIKGTYGEQKPVSAKEPKEQQPAATASLKGPVPACQKREKRREKRVSRKSHRSGSAKKGKADRERQRPDDEASPTSAPVATTAPGHGSPPGKSRDSSKKRLSPGGGSEARKPSAANSGSEGQRDFDFDISRRPIISGKYGRRETKKETGRPEPKIAVSKSLKGGKRASDKKGKPREGHESRKSHGRRSEKARDGGGIARSLSSSTAQASLTSAERATPEENADSVHAAAEEVASGVGRCDFDFVIGSRPATRGTLPRPDLTQVSEPAIVEAFERCQGAYVRNIRGDDVLATRADSESPPSGDWEGSGKDHERKSGRHRMRFDSKRSKSRSESRKSSSRGKKRDRRRRRHRKDSRSRRRRHDRGGRRRRGRLRSGKRRKRSRRQLALGSKAPAFCCGVLMFIAFITIVVLCVGLVYYYILVIKPDHTTAVTTAYTVIIDTAPEETTDTRWTGGKQPKTRITTPSPAPPPPPTPPAGGVYFCSTDYCSREARYIGGMLAVETNPCDNFYQHVCARWKHRYLNKVPEYVSFVSQETLLEEQLAARYISNIAGASHGDVQVAAKLYGACVDGRHRDNVSNRTMKAVFEGWTIQEWPRMFPVHSGTLAVWRFAAELVRDLGLATIVGASVGVNPDDLNATLVELYQPRLLLHEANVNKPIVHRFFTGAVEEAATYHRGESMPGLNESLFKVHSVLASLVHPSFGAAGEGFVVRQVGQLGQGLGQFLQVLLADVRSRVNRSEKVLLRSPRYLLDLEKKLNAVPPLDALNYMGLLVYIRVSPFLYPFSAPRLRLLSAETIMGHTEAVRDDLSSRLCSRIAESMLPDCFAKVSQKWRQSANQDVAAREWLSQLEGVFLRHVADFIYMNELATLLVRYRLKRRVITQFGRLADEQRQCAPTGSLSTENALLFFLNVTKRQQQQVFEGLLVNSSMLRHLLAATYSDLSDVATFERAFRTVHVPAALFNYSVPTNSSVFVFHLARVAVRLFQGLMQLLDENPYEHETPLGLTDESGKRRADLLACFARDAQKSLPARFGGLGVVDGQLGAVFMERTSALLLAAMAFDELLNVRRIWQMDLRLKDLPHLSAHQLFFIYFALDNCAGGDEGIHWKRLPAEQLVNVALRHTRQFAEAFGCRGGVDRMAASPGGEFCQVFRRHPRERRLWEARRSRSRPAANGTPAAEDA